MRKFVLAVSALFMGTQICAMAATIPDGTEIQVRTDQRIDMQHWNDQGRVYAGHVANDVLDRNGKVAIPRGAPAELIVRQERDNDMTLDLESVTVNGQRYVVDTRSKEFNDREGLGKNSRTAKFVGGGALLGTIIGAIAGGGKGAAIGAVAGGAAGAGGQVLTKGGRIDVPAETVVTFKLDAPLHVANWRDPGYDRDGNHYHYQRDWYR